MQRPFGQIPWILAFLAGCGGAPASAPEAPRPPAAVAMASPQALGGAVPDDPTVAAVVAGYRQTMGEKLSAVLITASAELTPSGEPSNALGVLVADEMLAFLRERPGETVDCFITNDGGLRAPLYAGPVQLKHVYEVMPFDNELVIVEFDGATLQKVADVMAQKKGEPVSGMRMVIDPAAARATGVEVGGAPLDPARRYHVGTSDYLAESGWMSELAKGRPLLRTGALMRDAIITRLRVRGAAGGVLAPAVDDRIRFTAQEQTP